MIREIVFDTETTGFKPELGDRICEIAGLELIDHVPSGKYFQAYINPGIPMPEGAFKVHGLSDAFLADKPAFVDIIDGFLDFIGEATLIAHNAPFDMRFLNNELGLLDRAPLLTDRVIDTVALARVKFPGAEANLDALCRRFGVDRSKRTLHGALIDCELLAEVYIELIDARQTVLSLAGQRAGRMTGAAASKRPVPIASTLSAEEVARHRAFIASLGAAPLWNDWLKDESEP